MKFKALFVSAFLAFASLASAQTGVPLTYIVEVVSSTAANPLTALPVANGVLSVSYSAANGNQPLFTTPPPPVEVNPTRLVWADPVNSGRLYITQQTTFMNGIPRAGTATTPAYVFRVTANNADGSAGPTSVSNPFSLPQPVVLNPPAAVTGAQARP